MKLSVNSIVLKALGLLLLTAAVLKGPTLSNSQKGGGVY